jgi:hypothetical protein
MAPIGLHVPANHNDREPTTYVTTIAPDSRAPIYARARTHAQRANLYTAEQHYKY